MQECFFMFGFVIDKNIYCGRKCVDILDKFERIIFKIGCILFKEEFCVKYYFIEVSYGKSFYDVRQIQFDFNVMVEDSEFRLLLVVIFKFFKLCDKSD